MSYMLKECFQINIGRIKNQKNPKLIKLSSFMDFCRKLHFQRTKQQNMFVELMLIKFKK